MRSLITRFIPDARYETIMFRTGLVLYLAVILLGAIPGARTEIGAVAPGLVLHFVTYSCIAFLLACGTAGSAAGKAFKAFCIVAVMGAFDEAIQSLLPYRTGAFTDWYVDLSAALFIALLFPLTRAGRSAAS